MRKLASCATLIAITLLAGRCGCTDARAEPAPAIDRGAARAAAIAAYEARKNGTALPAVVNKTPACDGELVAWRRAKDVEFCAAPCTTDAECAVGERCRVLHYDGMPQGPAEPAIYADDVPEIFEDYEQEAALTADGMLLDEPPVCEGECTGEEEGLPIKPVKPLALCDPLGDAP